MFPHAPWHPIYSVCASQVPVIHTPYFSSCHARELAASRDAAAEERARPRFRSRGGKGSHDSAPGHHNKPTPVCSEFINVSKSGCLADLNSRLLRQWLTNELCSTRAVAIKEILFGPCQ